MSLRSSLATIIVVSQVLFAAGTASAQEVAQNNWYRVRTATNLTPMSAVGAQQNENAPIGNLHLLPGTEVNIMEESADGRFVLIGIDQDISADNPGVDANDPVLVWVSRDDLMKTNPEFIDLEALEALADMGIDMDDASAQFWSESGLIQSVAKKSNMTYCLRDVRLTAVKYTAKRNIPQGIDRAAIAYPAYKAKGWKSIKYSKSVPNGTACFYGGGRMDCCTKKNKRGKCIKRGACGHAAIKIGTNKWKGAGIRPVPHLPNTKSKKYTLQGCLTPP